MKEAWWVAEEDLDGKQKTIIQLPPDKSIMMIGPPGSGKTNLLLLRANYLFMGGTPNIAIVTFTRSLREFIALGGKRYDFPADKIQTSHQWAINFLKENGVRFQGSGDFSSDRQSLFDEIRSLVEKGKYRDAIGAIFLDEAQDYLPEEIKTFASLTSRLCVTADPRQKIFSGSNCHDALKNVVDEEVVLKRHYRNGQEVCKLADSIGEAWSDYMPMLPGCNYDEASKKSSVNTVKNKSFDEQLEEMISAVETQLKAYPEELIGIVTPLNDDLKRIQDRMKRTEMWPMCTTHGGGIHEEFNEETRICITNAHGAKGLEFRALHMIGCDNFRKFTENQRNLVFTTITRCKTSLTLYYSTRIPGYLEAALARMAPPPEIPRLKDVFGRKK